MEASVFAFLAGLSNLALSGAELTGALIMKLANISSNAPCNFRALPLLVLFCHVVLPIVIGIPFALFLLPNKKQTEAILPEDEEAAEEIEME